MKTQIRHACFETNSSSSHSLTVSNAGRYSPNKMPIIKEYYTADTDQVVYPNAIVLTGGEYGWGYDCFTQPWEKANYLATHLIHYSDNPEERKMFEEVLIEETGAENVIFDFSEEDGYIDHQSIGDAKAVFTSKEELKTFLFNDASELIISNDNGC